jgi:hypothetical protein
MDISARMDPSLVQYYFVEPALRATQPTMLCKAGGWFELSCLTRCLAFIVPGIFEGVVSIVCM